MQQSDHFRRTAGPLIGALRIKPHGSCSFVADTGSNVFIGTKITGGGLGTQYFEGLPKCVRPDQVPGEMQTGFPSVMSLYAPGKQD
jgi:hypothetical protein